MTIDKFINHIVNFEQAIQRAAMTTLNLVGRKANQDAMDFAKSTSAFPRISRGILQKAIENSIGNVILDNLGNARITLGDTAKLDQITSNDNNTKHSFWREVEGLEPYHATAWNNEYVFLPIAVQEIIKAKIFKKFQIRGGRSGEGISVFVDKDKTDRYNRFLQNLLFVQNKRKDALMKRYRAKKMFEQTAAKNTQLLSTVMERESIKEINAELNSN